MKFPSAFFKPEGMNSHSKRTSLDLKCISIHKSILLGPSGSQNSDQSYESNFSPSSGQDGGQFRELGTNF
jgi:hypothetical protein